MIELIDSSLQNRKRRLDKQKDINVKLEMIYHWIKADKISKHNFRELLNYIRQGVSKSAMNQKKMPYIGTEDSELTLP